MNKSSFFIENKAIFGSFPKDEEINYFKSIGVVYFIDLTTPDEELKSYKDNLPENIKYLNFPIRDRSIPDNTYEFSKFVIQVQKHKLIYI